MLGATGPVDAAKRRPWIDWIHTARDQGALVRGYIKWDDQPASPAAAREALLRATMIANAAPQGPVYINLDAEMQEAQARRTAAADRRGAATARASPTRRSARGDPRSGRALRKAAKRPVILAGRRLARRGGWNARVALAEALERARR